MKYRRYKIYQEKKRQISGKKVVGIDPGKERHQAVVINEEGLQMDISFSFQVSYKGYNEELWKKLGKILKSYTPEEVVFAVENSCDLWKTITAYLVKKGYTVLLVSPLTTYHSRPMMNNDFSKTDQKDALLIAENAQNGKYNRYKTYTPEINKLHSLCIAYDKLVKDKQRNISRLRALMEEIFPEYLKCIDVAIDTSLHLLERYFLPEHFLELDVKKEAPVIWRISKGNHGMSTLLRIKELAEKTIGVDKRAEEESVRLILNSWISQIRQLNEDIKAISNKMIELAKGSEYFEVLTSLLGISDISAARFIGECRDLNLYKHYKEIEKLAGLNLRVSDSGKYEGTRRISKIGNKRLSKLIYQMTTQTARFIPEVRIKFLNRQMKKQCYRNNIIASSSVLLKLLMALIKQRRLYEFRDEKVKELAELEMKYKLDKGKIKRKKKRLIKEIIKEAA